MACREFEMGRVCILNTKLNDHCPCGAICQYLWSFICQIRNCKIICQIEWECQSLHLYAWKIMNPTAFLCSIYLHYYVGVISVEYMCLYTKPYQWSVSGHVTMEKKPCSLWDVGQLSKSWVLQDFLSIDTAVKTIYLLNLSAIVLWPEKEKKVVQNCELQTFTKNKLALIASICIDVCLHICRQSWSSCPNLQRVFWLYLLVI